MNRFRSGARVRIASVAGACAAVFVLAGCGGPAEPHVYAGGSPDSAGEGADDDGELNGDEGDAAAGSCLAGAEDCVDTDLSGEAGEDPVLDEGLDEAAVLRDAESLIGQAEDEVLELWGDVRMGRQGEEQYMLTQDYIPGRKTIATEDDGTGTFRVVEVVVELTDGPVTLTEGS